MNDLLRELLLSKKFIAAVAGVIVGLAAKKGLAWDTETVAVIISPLVAYVVGQGVADRGKEAAKVSASAELEKLNGRAS